MNKTQLQIRQGVITIKEEKREKNWSIQNSSSNNNNNIKFGAFITFHRALLPLDLLVFVVFCFRP